MEDKYLLAVETKPHNYFPIDLLDLNISPKYPIYKIEELDSFTLKYTTKEILQSIREANLLELAPTMPLVVVYKENNGVRKTEPLTKDNSYDMWAKLKKMYNDKNSLNMIYNFLKNKVGDQELSNLKSSQNIEEFLSHFASIPYIIQRKLYLYLYEK